jgi:VWFA-related protein
MAARLRILRHIGFPALALAAGAASVQAATPPRSATFSETIDVNVVNLDVRAEDKTGAEVTDLTLDDFEVLENGKKVRLEHLFRFTSDSLAAAPGTSASAGTAGRSRAGAAAVAERDTRAAPSSPLRLAVVIDLDNSRLSDRQRILSALATFLGGRSSSLEVMVLTYSVGGVKIALPFSASGDAWAQAFDAAQGGATRVAARELEQQQMMDDIGDALKQAQVDRSAAAALLQELIARAQHYATASSHESRMLIESLEKVSGALAALPGPKSLLYVGEGFSMRPGQEVFDLLSTVFEDDRRFGDRSVVASSGSSDGSASDGGPERAAGSSGGTVVSLPPRTASPLLRTGMMGVDLTREVQALTAAANAQRVTFHAISSGRPGALGSRVDIGRGAKIAATLAGNDSPSGLTVFESARAGALQASLDHAAEATGGLAAAAGADVSRFLERMWSRSTSYYSLAYAIPHPEEPGVRRLKVKVKRPGVRVHHREAYVVKPAATRIGDLLAGALLLRTGENAHRLETGLASRSDRAGPDGTWSVQLGLNVPIAELDLLPDGTNHRAALQVYVLTMDERGRLSKVQFAPLAFAIPDEEIEEARQRRFAATFPLVLEAGTHHVAVGLSEASANRLSVALTTVAVGPADRRPPAAL